MTQATDTHAPAADPAVLNLRRMALRTAGEVVELRQRQAATDAELAKARAQLEAMAARLGESSTPDVGGT